MNDKRRYSTAQIGDLLGGQLRPAFRKFGMAGAQIMTHWNEIIGHPLSTICIPERVRFQGDSKNNGTLILRVAPGWALEIQHQSHVIIERIACFTGYAAIEKIVIRQDHTLVPKKPAPPALPELSETDQRRLEKLLHKTTDKTLREKLSALGQAVIALESQPQRR